MDRRTVLKGALVVAASTPVLAIAPELPVTGEELPVDRVNRLAEELANALDEWNAQTNLKFSAQVAPASSGMGIYFRNERFLSA